MDLWTGELVADANRAVPLPFASAPEAFDAGRSAIQIHIRGTQLGRVWDDRVDKAGRSHQTAVLRRPGVIGVPVQRVQVAEAVDEVANRIARRLRVPACLPVLRPRSI